MKSPIQTIMRPLAATLLALLLLGCGQKGALYFPEDRPKQPNRTLLNKAAPQDAASKSTTSTNTKPANAS